MKQLLISIVVLSALAGCASNSELNENRLTTKEIHERQQQNLYGGKLEQARASWDQMDNRVEDGRVKWNDDLRLPNPELVMYVAPARQKDGSVRPGYEVKFAMYEQVHYKVSH